MPKHFGHNKTHHIGGWSWNSNTLHSNIQSGNPDDCWQWTGSKGPSGNLFGAYRDHKGPQMTQPNRLLYMESTGLPATEISVTMRCGNKFCCNQNHWQIEKNKCLKPHGSAK